MHIISQAALTVRCTACFFKVEDYLVPIVFSSLFSRNRFVLSHSIWLGIWLYIVQTPDQVRNNKKYPAAGCGVVDLAEHRIDCSFIYLI